MALKLSESNMEFLLGFVKKLLLNKKQYGLWAYTTAITIILILGVWKVWAEPENKLIHTEISSNFESLCNKLDKIESHLERIEEKLYQLNGKTNPPN